MKKVYIKPTTYKRGKKTIHRKGHYRKITPKVRRAAKKNIKKAQKKWKRMSSRARRRRMPG